MGLGGRTLRFMVISVGGDGSARVGMMTRPACFSRVAGALQAHLGLARLAWAASPVLCPVDDRSSVVEVGSSYATTKLLSLVPAVSCTTTLYAMRHWSRRDGDVDLKTVVGLARGRRSLVVALLCV
jgi:hypothetical protein